METIPTSQTFPLMFRHHCVPAVCSVFLQIVTKGCEWLRGAALRCPALISSSSLLFNSLTSVLTWTDRLPIHPLSVPHSLSSSPCIILSVSLLALEQCRFAHRRNHRRFRINSCLFLYKVASLSLSSCFCSSIFFCTFTRGFLLNMSWAGLLFLCYAFHKHMAHYSISSRGPCELLYSAKVHASVFSSITSFIKM